MQTWPMIMNVAVPLDQHSLRLGHLASSQTVAIPLRAMIPRVAPKLPKGNGLFSHGGSRRPGEGGFDSTTVNSMPQIIDVVGEAGQVA